MPLGVGINSWYSGSRHTFIYWIIKKTAFLRMGQGRKKTGSFWISLSNRNLELTLFSNPVTLLTNLKALYLECDFSWSHIRLLAAFVNTSFFEGASVILFFDIWLESYLLDWLLFLTLENFTYYLYNICPSLSLSLGFPLAISRASFYVPLPYAHFKTFSLSVCFLLLKLISDINA